MTAHERFRPNDVSSFLKWGARLGESIVNMAQSILFLVKKLAKVSYQMSLFCLVSQILVQRRGRVSKQAVSHVAEKAHGARHGGRPGHACRGQAGPPDL